MRGTMGAARGVGGSAQAKGREGPSKPLATRAVAAWADQYTHVLEYACRTAGLFWVWHLGSSRSHMRSHVCHSSPMVQEGNESLYLEKGWLSDPKGSRYLQTQVQGFSWFGG